MRMQIVIDIPQGLKIDFENENWTALTCAEMKDALMCGIPLDKIKTEIRKHCERYMDGDIIADEVIQAVENIGKAESDHRCHTCKHYTSGEYDGSCDSYICEHYSNWEARDEE